MKQHSTLSLIGLVLLGWSIFSVADAISKYLSAFYAVPQILVTSGLIGITITASWVLLEKGIKGFKTSRLKWHILRAVIVVGISYSVVSAFSKLPLADVYGIVFTAPFITLILIALFLHEHIGIHRWGAVAVGFIGAVILIGPQFETFNAGLVYACSGAFFIGASAVAIRKIGKEEYLPLYAFYPLSAMLLFNLPLAVPHLILPTEPLHIGLFLLHALSVTGGIFLTTYAIAHIRETAILSPFLYIQIIWGTFFGIVLFGDIPTWTTMLGLSLIISAGLYSIWREHVNYKKSHSL